MRIALFWVLTQRVVVILYRRFRSTYRSHLQGSSIQEQSIYFVAKAWHVAKK